MTAKWELHPGSLKSLICICTNPRGPKVPCWDTIWVPYISEPLCSDMSSNVDDTDGGELTWHTAETGFCGHRHVPLWISGSDHYFSIFYLQRWLCVCKCRWDDGKEINVIFHCVVLDAELEISVINKMNERLLKIRHMNSKSFL